MREAIQLALGYVFVDVPWYLLACIPFMDRRRISKRNIYLLAAFMAAFRAACGLILVLGVPNWRAYVWVAYLATYLLLALLFLLAFRVSPARLFYVYLLVYSISTCINHASSAALQYLFPGQRISVSAFPLLTVVCFGCFLLLLPLLYSFFKGSLKRAVETLDTRSLLLLCITPLTFAAIALAFMSYVNQLAEKSLFLTSLYLLVSLAGVVSYCVNLWMLLGAARRLQSEHELETRLAVQAKDFETRLACRWTTARTGARTARSTRC